MVHNKVGYDMCLFILYNLRARNQIITVVSVKLRLFVLLPGNTALDEEVWREKERKGSSAITVSPTDQQRRNLNREEKWSTGLKGTFMEVGLVPAGDRRGRGRGFEIHTEEHNWDEMDGSVKVEKRFLWSWVERVVRGG